jgi:caspase domain-containing protein
MPGNRVWVAVLFMVAGSVAAFTEDVKHYWYITHVPDGKFYYRNKSEEKLRLSDYIPLLETSEVLCEAKPCELSYVSEQSDEPQKLKIRILPKIWTSLASAEPKPDWPVPPAEELSVKLPARAGREKGGLCLGSISVQAPTCDELIDIDTFGLEWTPPPDIKGRIEIRFTPMDSTGSSVEEFSPASVQIEDGHYSSPLLRNYLTKIQRNDGRVKLLISLARSASERATRVVMVPSLQEQEQFRRKMLAVEVPNKTLRSLGRMWVALQENKWTVAAQEALALQARQAKDKEIPQLLAYALVGLCKSGYDDHRESLRVTLTRTGAADMCPAMASSKIENTATESTPQPIRANRVGIALLIGNSDYPDDQLDAVRHDIEGMEKVLRELGFEVNKAENLDKSQDFSVVIDNFLKGASADDIVFAYYSGHGMQYKEKTYLLGKNYAQEGHTAVSALSYAFKLDDLVERIRVNTQAFARIVVFDGCRNNIIANEDTQEGDVAFGHKTANTFIMLANRPGKTVAARATGEFHSPFTEGLIYAFSRAKGGMPEIFELAKEKTKEMSPGQEPELLTSDSDKLDPTILSGSSNKAKSNRPQEMLEKACPYYHSRAWETYVPIMRVANTLTEDPAGRLHISAEIQLAELIQKAEAEGANNNNGQAAQLWKQAAAMYPGRNWVRMRAALAALAMDDVQSALAELAAMPTGPDASIPERSNLLWAELSRSFPKQAELARSAATQPQMAEEPECVIK